MLRLPFRFPLLRAQAFKLLDDAREFFLEREPPVLIWGGTTLPNN
jgi:hypothetical protein